MTKLKTFPTLESCPIGEKNSGARPGEDRAPGPHTSSVKVNVGKEESVGDKEISKSTGELVGRPTS